MCDTDATKILICSKLSFSSSLPLVQLSDPASSGHLRNCSFQLTFQVGTWKQVDLEPLTLSPGSSDWLPLVSRWVGLLSEGIASTQIVDFYLVIKAIKS